METFYNKIPLCSPNKVSDVLATSANAGLNIFRPLVLTSTGTTGQTVQLERENERQEESGALRLFPVTIL